jgi:hypothetical protein
VAGFAPQSLSLAWVYPKLPGFAGSFLICFDAHSWLRLSISTNFSAGKVCWLTCNKRGKMKNRLERARQLIGGTVILTNHPDAPGVKIRTQAKRLEDEDRNPRLVVEARFNRAGFGPGPHEISISLEKYNQYASPSI